MPIGFLVNAALVTVCALLALRPPLPSHSSRWNLRFVLGFLINEQPFLGLYWLASATVPPLAGGEIDGAARWFGLALVAVPTALLTMLAVRARTARPVMEAALDGDLAPATVEHRRRRLPLLRVLVIPIVSWRPGVRRYRNVRYGDAGRGNTLDVYVRRGGTVDSPVFVYLHGGAFRIGNKLLGARPLLYRLAASGWVCVSANYRLQPRVGYGEELLDVKRVVRWVREHAAEHGADASTVFLAGGSSGAHLAATAALTADDAGLQPGFEHVDTSVSGVVCFYGYYGDAGSESPVAASPRANVHAGAPPFLVVHGELDTLVIERDARQFADALRATSRSPVVYAALPGTQHNFDLFHSIRFHAVCDAVESFTDAVRATRHHPPGV
jgi:acetyl esterase/lipase